MTGQRATAEEIVKIMKTNLQKMNVEPTKITALCTDNPTTMQAACRTWAKEFPGCTVSVCSR